MALYNYKSDLQDQSVLLAAADKHDRPISILLALGELRGTQDRVDEAVQVYREILKRDENNVWAMNNLAVLLALQKRGLSEARQLVEKAIEIAGPLPALLDSRASVYLALGQPQRALSDLQQVVGEDPRPNRQFHLALAYFRRARKGRRASPRRGTKAGLDARQVAPVGKARLSGLDRQVGTLRRTSAASRQPTTIIRIATTAETRLRRLLRSRAHISLFLDSCFPTAPRRRRCDQLAGDSDRPSDVNYGGSSKIAQCRRALWRNPRW